MPTHQPKTVRDHLVLALIDQRNAANNLAADTRAELLAARDLSLTQLEHINELEAEVAKLREQIGEAPVDTPAAAPAEQTIQ